jgi:two-component system, sporulation sensor kinase A
MKTSAGRRFALKITLYYVLFAGFWVLTSDSALHLITHDIKTFLELGMFKAGFFIIITAWILYKLILRENNKRKRAEAALNEAESKYRSLVEEALVGVYLCQDGRFQYVNPRYAEICGYSQEELLKMDIADLCVPEDKDKLAVNLQKLLSGEIANMHHEGKGLRKDNSIVEFEVIRSLTVYNGKPAIIGTLLDITERKRTEELLQNAEKLSAVGELAAGIAHEIRNPLTSLRGFVQLFKSEDTNGMKRMRHEVMLSEIDRINEIVSELLVLAKPSNETYELGNIIDKINHIITLFEGQANLYNVKISQEFDTDLPLIRSQSSLKQVFLNVLKNAIESMPHGGEVLIQVNGMDDQVCIRFVDQGCGIPQDRLEKIFQPFFTTKETGTGLGLMVCQRIIQNHKGTMRIESEVGKGTTVEVILPIS